MKILTTSVASLLLLASVSTAQQVTFRGKVEDVQGTQNQFVLGCTNTELTSAVIDLNAFVAMPAEITGQWNGSVSAPMVVVETLTLVTETFEIGGGAKIGDTSTLVFTGTPGDLAIGVLSIAPTFVPYRRSNGVIFVNTATSHRILQRVGTVGGTGILEISFPIPNDPSLVGFDFFGQGALAAGGTIRMTNPDCKTIGN